jgi:hypothetical protein
MISSFLFISRSSLSSLAFRAAFAVARAACGEARYSSEVMSKSDSSVGFTPVGSGEGVKKGRSSGRGSGEGEVLARFIPEEVGEGSKGGTDSVVLVGVVEEEGVGGEGKESSDFQGRESEKKWKNKKEKQKKNAPLSS